MPLTQTIKEGVSILIWSSHSTYQPPKRVIPTEASRRFFFSFAPAKLSARAVEESLFDLSRKPPSSHQLQPGSTLVVRGWDFHLILPLNLTQPPSPVIPNPPRVRNLLLCSF